MLYNFLDNTEKRSISTCNYNRHICAPHPDRIMEEHDLIYIREGHWSIAQDGINYDLMPDDVILLQAGHHHYGEKPCTSAVKTCFIHFNAHINDSIGDAVTDNPDLWIFPMVVHCKNNPMVKNYFNRIIHSYWSEDKFAEKKATAYLDLLLCELVDRGKIKKQRDSVVEDIKLQIKNTPSRFISNKEFAEQYHCSVKTISSKFKENTGCSLHAWQMKIKCQMADELMQYEPSITLKELAATYGFYDEYHFGKCFKKTIGYSPKRSK